MAERQCEFYPFWHLIHWMKMTASLYRCGQYMDDDDERMVELRDLAEMVDQTHDVQRYERFMEQFDLCADAINDAYAQYRHMDPARRRVGPIRESEDCIFEIKMKDGVISGITMKSVIEKNPDIY